MAVRRLISGWLGVLAALARSVAQALERASEDQSASASNPVMAALAERYPGAPAHWLAHIAERTSQLAEAGEAPLSLNSDPAIWPSIQPQALPPPLEAMDRAPVSREPAPARPSSRREAAIPTLAALRERPSETWRRPDLVPKRRPRPVFASPPPAVGPEPPARTAPGPTASASARQPRSPLSVKTDTRSRPTSEMLLATAASEAPVRQAAGADTPRNPVERSRATTAPSVQAPSIGSDPDVRTVAEERAARGLDAHGDRVQPTAISPDLRPSILETLVQGPVRIARLFTPRPKPLKCEPAALAAETSVTFPRATRDLETAAVRPSLPDRRRPIFPALAAFQVRSGAERPPVADPPVASTPLRAHWMPVHAPRRASVPGFEPQMATFPDPPAAFSRQDHDESTTPIRPVESIAQPRIPKASAVERAARALDGEAAGGAKRSTFTAPGAAPSRFDARRFADPPPEVRWPGLPPAIFASPQGVAAPPPRWEDLAREQEEGRWSV